MSTQTSPKTDITSNGAALSISNIARGAMSALFSEAIADVMRNIADKDTDEKATREIHIILKFKPSAGRTWADCVASVKKKLAPHAPLQVGFKIGSAGGEVFASEVIEDQGSLLPQSTHPEAK